MMDMKKQYLLGSFIISALLVPVLASAQSASDIQAQIQSLLSQITALQQQLSNLSSNTSTTVSTSSNSCPNLHRALSRGSRGNDVILLQQFLIVQGFLSNDSATGFFGSMTEAAVQKWQAQNSIVSYGDANTTGYGVVGAKTRAAFAARCGTTSPPTVRICTNDMVPVCATGQHIQRGAPDANGCPSAPVCVNDTTAQSCPTYNIPACSSGTLSSLGTNANGCNLGYRCIPAQQPTIPVQQSSSASITVLSPNGNETFNVGDGTKIKVSISGLGTPDIGWTYTAGLSMVPQRTGASIIPVSTSGGGFNAFNLVPQNGEQSFDWVVAQPTDVASTVFVSGQYKLRAEVVSVGPAPSCGPNAFCVAPRKTIATDDSDQSFTIVLPGRTVGQSCTYPGRSSTYPDGTQYITCHNGEDIFFEEDRVNGKSGVSCNTAGAVGYMCKNGSWSQQYSY